MTYTLWPACVKTHAFSDQLAAASSAGFDTLAIGRLTYRHLVDEQGYSAADIRRMADDQGVALGHYDGFAQWAPCAFDPGLPEVARQVFADSADDCLAMCDALGLPAICATGVFDRTSADTSLLIDAFGEFSERAGRHGVQVDLECIPFWGLPDLSSAWALVDGAGVDNTGVLLDSWHFFRGGGDLDLLRSMPPGSIKTVQLADAVERPPGRELLEDCLRYRRLPGQGVLPLQAFLEILAEKGGVTCVGPEIFSDELDGMDAVTAAELASQACRAALARSKPDGADQDAEIVGFGPATRLM